MNFESTSKISLPLKTSENGVPNAIISQVDFEIFFQAEQIINILNHTSQKVQLAVSLK